MTKFIPEIWSAEVQRLLSEKLKMEKPVHATITDYTNLTKNTKAGGYNGPLLGAVAAKKLPIDDEHFQELAKSSYNMSFDNNVGVPVLIGDITAAQSILGIRQIYGELAVDALIDYYNQAAINEMIDETAELQRITLTDTENNKLTKADFLVAHKKLNQMRAPRTNRYCVIGPEYESHLYNIADFISRDKIANSNAMSEAAVGKLLGFEVLLMPNMPKVDSDGDVDAKGTLNVAVFYHRTCCGFGRNIEFGAREESKAGVPGIMANIWNVFGTKIHPGDLGKRLVTIRDNSAAGSS